MTNLADMTPNELGIHLYRGWDGRHERRADECIGDLYALVRCLEDTDLREELEFALHVFENVLGGGKVTALASNHRTRRLADL
jgi:hypothetical protein